MQHHENQYKTNCHQAKDQTMHRNEERQVVCNCQGHDGDRRRVGGPEADPSAKKCQRTGPRFLKVNILAAILREGAGQFRIAEVGRDLQHSANQERQHQKQTASCGSRHLTQ